jgi:hypothetical protein
LINSPGLPLQPTKSLFFARVADTWTSALNDRAPDRGIGCVLIGFNRLAIALKASYANPIAHQIRLLSRRTAR